MEYINKLNRKKRNNIAYNALHGRADRLCDRIAIIDYGQIVALDTLRI